MVTIVVYHQWGTNHATKAVKHIPKVQATKEKKDTRALLSGDVNSSPASTNKV